MRLPVGRAHAVTQAAIARRDRISIREVQETLQRLRLEGEPICSGSEGVWLAETAQELADSNAALHARLRSQYRTLRAQRAAERRLRLAPATQAGLWS
jgi:hypothetical protein